MTEQERREKGVSRRTALKRIGAAGAIAWVTPVVSSLTTPAHAGTLVISECTECSGDFCFGQTICGHNGPLAVCGCAQQVDREGCFCYADDLCVNRTVCDSDADCPGNEVCVHTCCDTNPFVNHTVCFPPCGETVGTQRPATTSSGGSGTRP
jgi:hypothetical protein